LLQLRIGSLCVFKANSSGSIVAEWKKKRPDDLHGDRSRPWGRAAILVLWKTKKATILSAFVLLLALFAFGLLVSLSFWQPLPCSVHPF
jgi:hypothetical protein